MYYSQIDTVNQKLNERRACLVNGKGVLLVRDDVRPQVAYEIQRKLQSIKWEVLPCPPYIPDLSPSNYYLY